jgi:hypothetical protein
MSLQGRLQNDEAVFQPQTCEFNVSRNTFMIRRARYVTRSSYAERRQSFSKPSLRPVPRQSDIPVATKQCVLSGRSACGRDKPRGLAWVNFGNVRKSDDHVCDEPAALAARWVCMSASTLERSVCPMKKRAFSKILENRITADPKLEFPFEWASRYVPKGPTRCVHAHMETVTKLVDDIVVDFRDVWLSVGCCVAL